MSTPELRDQAYDDLHGRQFREHERTQRAAAKVLSILFEQYVPQSVLDVGCGVGSWLAAARQMGVAEIQGIEGPWLDPELLRIPRECVSRLDLEQPFDLQRRFDLVISLEVAEHLSARAADDFVGSLARHGDVVLFSAAIPFQGGDNHINEQWPSYWRAKFERLQFLLIDVVRGRIWWDANIDWWFRQNIVLYAREELVRANARLQELHRCLSAHPVALDVIHPDSYLHKSRGMDQLHTLLQLISPGGTFVVQRNAQGALTISRNSPA